MGYQFLKHLHTCTRYPLTVLLTAAHLGSSWAKHKQLQSQALVAFFCGTLCWVQRVFGRLFCRVWLVWKACSQRTLNTKYLLCWHLYYKLLDSVKKIFQLKLFSQTTQNCLFSNTIGNLLSNSSFFHQKSSFVLIHCEIKQNSTGRKTDLSVLGIEQSNHELVYWIVKKETALLGRGIYHTSGITTDLLECTQMQDTLPKNSPL